MFDSFNSLANIAKDTIARKNPFPKLDGFDTARYVCKWRLSDLYQEHEKTLRNAISERKTFDTGWCDCRKEICSFRFISNGEIITIMTSAEMDDVEDLIYDAIDDGIELTEEQTEEVMNWWYMSDLSTSTGSEITIPISTYEEIMEHLEKMEDRDAKELDRMFQIFKETVKEILSYC